MRIRTQILLGYAYLVALLLAGALGAAVSFYQLGHELDRILSSAGPSSRLSLESIFHRGVRDLLREFSDPGTSPSDSTDLEAFQQALSKAMEKCADPEESRILERMDRNFGRLRENLPSLPENGQPSISSALEFFPLVETIEKDLAELTAREEKFILEADSRLRREARIRTMAFSLLVILALLSLVLLSRELRRSLLARLDELRNLAHEIRQGHSHRRAFVASRDELGLLAEAINGLLDAWDEERHESRGRELRRRRIILGLLEAFERPAILALPDGRILASTLDRDEEEILGLLKKPEKAREQGWEIRTLETPQGAFVGSLLLESTKQPEDISP